MAKRLLFMIILLLIPLLLNNVIVKIIFVVGLLPIFVTVIWKYYFSDEEKTFFIKIFKKDYSFWNNSPR